MLLDLFFKDTEKSPNEETKGGKSYDNFLLNFHHQKGYLPAGSFHKKKREARI